ncbi:benzoate/H(+) symporter BenE family transporter [Aneurinibacillus terranovensis]|uniref:benzoate/H(+) symporter BenE family transporter n=1 Tax=Aneurinibacillus terranovensis TaxID=278991 RepID=UPI000485C728
MMLSSSLSSAMKEESHRESVLITLLVTISCVSIAGIGSAFCGLIAGMVANYILVGDVKNFFRKEGAVQEK